MRSSHSLDRLDTAFDDDRLVADAGLLLPATLAAHLGLKDLVDEHLNLGDRPGRANAGDKLLTPSSQFRWAPDSSFQRLSSSMGRWIRVKGEAKVARARIRARPEPPVDLVTHGRPAKRERRGRQRGEDRETAEGVDRDETPVAKVQEAIHRRHS